MTTQPEPGGTDHSSEMKRGAAADSAPVQGGWELALQSLSKTEA